MDRDRRGGHDSSEGSRELRRRFQKISGTRIWPRSRSHSYAQVGNRRHSSDALGGSAVHKSILNMLISRLWLQKFFDKPLPDAQALADALTLHAFEIESVKAEILDVKVTANRGHDCLSHRGIAQELSAILNIPMKSDALRHPPSLSPVTDSVAVSIAEPTLCRRYVAGYIRGVKVGPSPDW